MKRHPALTPLSREHHQLLVLAQVLKHDVPAYKNMPATPSEQRAYALERYTELLEPHFSWEEKVLFPLAERYGDKLQRLVAQVLEEHQALRDAFEKLPLAAEADLPQELDLLGRAVSADRPELAEPPLVIRIDDRRAAGTGRSMAHSCGHGARLAGSATAAAQSAAG